MAKYKYNALKSNNNIINGEIEASNPREAREKIRELGFLPTKIYLEQSQESQQYSDLISEKVNSSQINVSHLSLQEKIMFTSELHNPTSIEAKKGNSAPLNAKTPINAGNTNFENNISNPSIRIINIAGYIEAFIIFPLILSCFLNNNSILSSVVSNSPAFSPVFTSPVYTGPKTFP